MIAAAASTTPRARPTASSARLRSRRRGRALPRQATRDQDSAPELPKTPRREQQTRSHQGADRSDPARIAKIVMPVGRAAVMRGRGRCARGRGGRGRGGGAGRGCRGRRHGWRCRVFRWRGGRGIGHVAGCLPRVDWVGSVPPPTGDPILTMDRALTSPLCVAMGLSAPVLRPAAPSAGRRSSARRASAGSGAGVQRDGSRPSRRRRWRGDCRRPDRS